MRTVSLDLRTHLAGETTTIAWCWSITRTDNVTYYYTTHDVDITYDGNVYSANVSFVPSALAAKGDFSVDNLECLVFLDDGAISKTDVIAGLFNFARLDLFLVNYEDLTMGNLILAGGWRLGEAKMEENTVYFEGRSKTQLLDQVFFRVYTPECTADLGDSRCGVSLAAYTHLSDVTGTYSYRHQFISSGCTQATDVFAGEIDLDFWIKFWLCNGSKKF